MAPYTVEIEISAAKSLAKLDRLVQARILAAIEALATDPRPHGAIKLTGQDGMRIKVAKDYRIVYVIEDSIITVTVVKIGHRSKIYER